MSKRTMILSLLLALLLTACGSQAATSSTMMEKEPTLTIEATQQPPPTKTPQPTVGPAPLPSPTFTTDRIYMMGWGWADNDKEFSEEMISTSIQGNGLEKVNISLESNLDFSILVSIVPGTLFTPTSPSVQTMVARELKEIILEPHVEIEFELEVACANMHLNAPRSEDSLTALFSLSNPDLSKLVNSNSFIEEDSFRVQQFAVWVITDNLSAGNVVGLGSVGTGSGPSAEELTRIRQLFDKAGISVDPYDALN